MKKRLLYYPLCFLLVIDLVFPGVLFAKERLAVMNLKAKKPIKQELAETISVIIRSQIQGLGMYEVVSKEDIQELAERSSVTQKLGCADNQCLISFGNQLGSRFMVAGSIAKLNENYHVGIRLLDTGGKDPGVKARASRDAECTQDELPKVARVIAVKLINNYYHGSLGDKSLTEEQKKELSMKVASLDTQLAAVQEENIIEADRSWFWRHKWWILGGVVIAAAGAAAAGGGGSSSSGSGAVTDQPAGTQTGNVSFGW